MGYLLKLNTVMLIFVYVALCNAKKMYYKIRKKNNIARCYFANLCLLNAVLCDLVLCNIVCYAE